jgi:hypothetical protein
MLESVVMGVGAELETTSKMKVKMKEKMIIFA